MPPFMGASAGAETAGPCATSYAKPVSQPSTPSPSAESAVALPTRRPPSNPKPVTHPPPPSPPAESAVALPTRRRLILSAAGLLASASLARAWQDVTFSTEVKVVNLLANVYGRNGE